MYQSKSGEQQLNKTGHQNEAQKFPVHYTKVS
jgi:hypothetical protein